MSQTTADEIKPGDKLLIPQPGCALEAGQTQIVAVQGVGDVASEGITIRNTGNTLDITGWRITDGQGNEYVFSEQLLFSNTQITVYSGTGQNTPIAYYWGMAQPVWQVDDLALLIDERNQLQAVFRVK